MRYVHLSTEILLHIKPLHTSIVVPFTRSVYFRRTCCIRQVTIATSSVLTWKCVFFFSFFFLRFLIFSLAFLLFPLLSLFRLAFPTQDSYLRFITGNIWHKGFFKERCLCLWWHFDKCAAQLGWVEANVACCEICSRTSCCLAYDGVVDSVAFYMLSYFQTKMQHPHRLHQS